MWKARVDIGQLHELIRREQSHREMCELSTDGYSALAESHQSLVLRALEEIKSHPLVLNTYNFNLHILALKRLRTAELGFHAGYYLESQSHLRTIYEIVLYLASVLHGAIEFNEIHEFTAKIDPASASYEEVIKVHGEHARKLDKRIREFMVGANSGLTKSAKSELSIYLWNLHQSLHKSQTQLAFLTDSSIRQKRMPVVCEPFNKNLAVYYCNVAASIMWMWSRCVPYLSIPTHFSSDFHRNADILENGFRDYFNGWSSSYAPALQELMDKRFSFDPTIAESQIRKTQVYKPPNEKSE